MPDGDRTLRVELAPEELRRLTESAADAGAPVEAHARDLLLARLADDRWSVSRERLAKYDRTGQGISGEEALTHVDHEIEARLGKSR